MLSGLEEGLVWAVVGGVMQDLIIGLPTGTSALAFVAIVSLESLVLGPVGRNNLIFPPLVIVIGTVLYQAILAFILAVLGRLSIVSRLSDVNYVITFVVLPTLAFNTVFILPLFRLFGLMFEASRPRRVTL
jgi:rod shape-determining protein MreD